MSGTDGRQAGSALGALLGERDSAAPERTGRTLLLALIRLHALGALSFDLGAAVHGAGVVAEPSTVGGSPRVQRGGEDALAGGGRVALDGTGAVVRGAARETAPAYNMGQSVYMDEVEK